MQDQQRGNMFQSFVSTSQGSEGPQRLKLLRAEMKNEGVTAFLVPHADEHQNEYLPERAERLAWLTGFTGSAGFCIATLKEAIVFTDGRYTVQVREQIEETSFTPESLTENPPDQWLKSNMGDQDVIGYDPMLVTINQMKAYEKIAALIGCKLQPVDNLIDRVWKDQPEKPAGKVSLHTVKNAGKPADEKIQEIQDLIKHENCDHTLLTDPASLAWLFNIRGNDVIHNPLALGFSIVPASGKPLLFMENRKLGEEETKTLSTLAELHEPESLTTSLKKFADGKSILCDPNRIHVGLANIIKEAGGNIIHGRDPVILPRAIKNETEIKGARAAHIRDGVAMCKFLCWLDNQASGSLTEIDAAKKLEEIRISNAEEMGSELKEISFDTISASGPHAALPHYRVNEQSNRTLNAGEIYLVDSGGQYEDGTTDITRTIAIGEPENTVKTDFTLVLKGHIAIDEVRFPEGTRGIDLDSLARHALWQNGKDYAHGTGHGVGSYMNVHEGPQGIHRRAMEILKPGMIISNEPGYYVEDSHGIRIENLIIVKDAVHTGGNIKTHTFENITWTPIDKRLVDKSLLNEAECNWLDKYHETVMKKLSPYLKGAELEWLESATSPL
jgi:Xaa-Pro aminopeptidase